VGIAAGTVAGGLIICILLAFFLFRRRKGRDEKVQEMVNAAVAAATQDQNSKYPNVSDRHLAPFTKYKMPSSPIPYPIAQPHQNTPVPTQNSYAMPEERDEMEHSPQQERYANSPTEMTSNYPHMSPYGVPELPNRPGSPRM
jgi:hypothetical protein